uniref:Uncharacterized protein n=1 Tax=Rhodnius prolixus TaxID=13249 RepID=T1IBB5_RHOPR
MYSRTLIVYLFSFLQIYCFLCVVSQYQEYKEGRGTADFEFINRRVPGVRYVPQPTGTSFLSTRRAVTYQETKASPTCSPPGLTEKTPHRKHVQFGELSPPPYEEVVKQRLAPPQQQQPSSIIHIESPKDKSIDMLAVRVIPMPSGGEKGALNKSVL